jgi:hypothetical protein
MPKPTKDFHCELCDFHANKLSNWNLHLSTRKHQVSLRNKSMETVGTVLETKMQEKMPDDNKVKYCCGNCKKTFKVRSGLWKHKKNCESLVELNTSNNTEFVSSEKILNVLVNKFTDVTNKLVDNYTDVTNTLLEQSSKNIENTEKLVELAQRPTIINNMNNSNNKTFNLNIFLNEDCKNAQNITDFINNLQIEFDDLENVGRLGYVEGISNIIIKSLKNMDVKERPIHCTDLKRETLYIKDADRWNKENEEKEKLRKLIEKVANKNLRTLPKWCDLHPDSEDLDSREYSVFHNIYKNSLGGEGENEQKKFNEKIIKNISKNVLIEKS